MNFGKDRKTTHWLRFVIIMIVLFVLVSLLLKSQTTLLKSPFELEAAEQWIVRQDQPGEITARLTLGRRQTVQGLQVYRYERNDLISCTLNSNLTEGCYLPVGYPVLLIDSLNDNSQKDILQARVHRLQEQLTVLQEGEYQAKIQEAEQNLVLMETNLLTYIPLVESRRNLVEKGALSGDELRQFEDEYFRRKQEIEVSRASLAVRRMQIAPGIVNMARYELEETQHELAMVNTRISNCVLRTPIPGRLTRSSGSSDILLRVVNENNLYARIIIPLAYLDKVKIGDPVELHFFGKDTAPIESPVEQITVESVMLVGQSVLHVLVPVKNDGGDLAVAMTGEAFFPDVQIDPLSMLWRQIKYTLQRPIHKDKPPL